MESNLNSFIAGGGILNKKWPYRDSKHSGKRRERHDHRLPVEQEKAMLQYAEESTGVDPVEEVVQFFREKQKGVSRVRKFWDALKESTISQILLIALFGGGTIYLLVTGQPVPGELWGIDATIVGFFFGSKLQKIAK